MHADILWDQTLNIKEESNNIHNLFVWMWVLSHCLDEDSSHFAEWCLLEQIGNHFVKSKILAAKWW